MPVILERGRLSSKRQEARGKRQKARSKGQEEFFKANLKSCKKLFKFVVAIDDEMAVTNFREEKAFKVAYELAMEIFEISKAFPKEERYSLTDQIRRSSRSVCANIGEAYRKRAYPAHFISKSTDADAENTETGIWLDFSFSRKFISTELHKKLRAKRSEIGNLIHHMIVHPDLY